LAEPDHENDTLARAKAGDQTAREELLQAYKPLVQRVAVAFCRRRLEWGHDDELSVGLIALNEAIDSYAPGRGATFSTYAYMVIKSRLIDYQRRENRQQKVVVAAVDHAQEVLPGDDEWLAWERGEEIRRYAQELAGYGISLRALAAASPRHQDTRRTLLRAARCLATAPLFDELRRTRRVPMQELAERASVHRKQLERGRKYIVALALVFGAPEQYSHMAAYLAGLDGGERDAR
jgi:RNA polymerase sigma factor